jgi:hypothetical protein
MKFQNETEVRISIPEGACSKDFINKVNGKVGYVRSFTNNGAVVLEDKFGDPLGNRVFGHIHPYTFKEEWLVPTKDEWRVMRGDCDWGIKKEDLKPAEPTPKDFKPTCFGDRNTSTDCMRCLYNYECSVACHSNLKNKELHHDPTVDNGPGMEPDLGEVLEKDLKKDECGYDLVLLSVDGNYFVEELDDLEWLIKFLNDPNNSSCLSRGYQIIKGTKLHSMGECVDINDLPIKCETVKRWSLK